VLGNPVLLLVVGVLIPVQAYRARKEEAVLAAAFGEEYARYKAGRGSEARVDILTLSATKRWWEPAGGRTTDCGG
jgi:hypothetical protein